MKAARQCPSCGAHEQIRADKTGDIICAYCGGVMEWNDRREPAPYDSAPEFSYGTVRTVWYRRASEEEGQWVRSSGLPER